MADTPPESRFAVEANRSLTHFRRLREMGADVEREAFAARNARRLRTLMEAS